ncbi:SET domain-containing protein [Panus rudis PR-1116 ss-1]|nr:SET domain-containing protein [Panus rudis PR-1116 ss-1]
MPSPATVHPGPFSRAKVVRIPDVDPLNGRPTFDELDLPEIERAENLSATLPYRRDDPTTFDDVTVECIIPEPVKQAILSLPNFPQPVKANKNPAFTIRPDGNSGVGMFAARDLAVGDLILAERPLMLTAMGMGVPTPMMAYIASKIDRHDAFLALRNVKGYTRSFIKGIYDTNAIGIAGLPGYPHAVSAICNNISRINHSCDPNCFWNWHLESFAVEVRATKHIKKGEQIFGAYTTVSQPRDARRKFLLERYKFYCQCTVCSLPDDESKASNARRMKIMKLARSARPGDTTRVTKWINDPTTPDNQVVDECLEVIRLMEKEGIWPSKLWTATIERLVQAYCSLKNAKRASFGARRASALFKAYNFGEDSAGWSAVAENPKGTTWWSFLSDTRQMMEAMSHHGVNMLGDTTSTGSDFDPAGPPMGFMADFTGERVESRVFEMPEGAGIGSIEEMIKTLGLSSQDFITLRRPST